MANSAGAGRIDQKDGPIRAARAGGEHLVSFDDIAALNPLHRGTEPNLLARCTRLRLAAPGDPFVALFNHPFEPTRLLLRIRHPVQKHQRIYMTLPTAGQRHIGLGDLFGHHPQRENVPAVRTKPQSTVFSGNHGRV